MPTSPREPAAPIGAILVLSAASLVYLVMLANLAPDGGTDAAGRGLAQAFAVLIGIVLWLLLAVLLVIGAAHGRMPLAATLAAVVLLPASAVAAFHAMDLIDHGNQWAIAVPAALPPLIAAYALWARLPGLHGCLPPLPTSLVAAIAVVLLSVLPFAASWYGQQPDPARDARLAQEARARQAEEQRQVDGQRARETAGFASLGPDSHLADYLPFLQGEHAKEALQGMRQAKSRQADAVGLLQTRALSRLPDLQALNLAPTPELCQAYGAALARAAAGVSPKVRTDFLSAAIEAEGELANIRWLLAAQCDLGQPLGLLEANVRAVADSERMTKFADRLAALRRAK